MPRAKKNVPAKKQIKRQDVTPAPKQPARPVAPPAKAAKRPVHAKVPAHKPKHLSSKTTKPAAKVSHVHKRAAKKRPATQPVAGWRLVVAWCTPERLFAIAAVVALFATTWYWALLGARVHMGNADQLVNTYLFDSPDSFHGAQWPDQHTFLLKWPLFALIHAAGATPHHFRVATVAVTLLTVMALAFILYRIERRPLIFGCLCLALASVLLMVPIQPYPGGLLPVNMAMTTTRNLEYLLFIAAIAFVIHAPRLLHWKTLVAIGLFIVLIASDKLFLTIGVGASLAMLVGYALLRKLHISQMAARWMVAGFAGAAGAIGLLWVINASGITHIASGGVAGPYGLVHSTKDLALGMIYAVIGLLTNLGANPATDTRLLRDIPTQVYHNVFTSGGLPFVINILFVMGAVFVVARLLWSSISRRGSTATLPHDRYFALSLSLIWTTAAACAVFIVSKHYYPVDARYVAIVLFAVFVSIATYVRARHYRPRTVWLAAVVLGCSVFAGVTVAGQQYNADIAAMQSINDRNTQVANALNGHGVDAVVGDYWRVFPIKLQATDITAVPLGGCTQPGAVLNSQAWQPDLGTHSFAYLLSLDKGLTGYPPCRLDDIIGKYGRPNASTLIDGTLSNPHELLLFYDRGAHRSEPHAYQPTAKLPSTIIPIPLTELPYTACTTSTTVMNVVAHQDDDLLFMNPDVRHDIQAGRCVRTIYVTSGDAGAGPLYWISREQGSEAAYTAMLGHSDVWIKRLVVMPGGQYITIANPRGNPNISLIFLHLPDGNLRGQGFEASHHESLQRLEVGAKPLLHTVDHQSTYSYADVTGTLGQLMRVYQPAEIRTQSNFVSRAFPDHGDHMAVGRATHTAYTQYIDEQFGGAPSVPLKYYIGYPVRGFGANVSGSDLDGKEAAFFTYARYDGNVCATMEICAAQDANYKYYLHRQYTSDY
jgi:LmbE family N-acetylglucosaminyl deacetylase